MSDTLSEAEVIRRLEDKVDGIRISAAREVYYPYLKVILSFRVKGRIARFDQNMMCLVDLVNGRPAVGQGKPHLVESDVPAEDVLPAELSLDDAGRIAHDHGLRMFIGKMRILQTPTITPVHEEQFHKKFYVVQCLDERGLAYHLMVDALDGEFALLDEAGF